MLETRIRVASSDHLRVPAPQPTAWHLILGFSLWCHGLPTAAKIFWLFCALLWGELPGIGACSAIPVANHQSSSQSYLACIMGTGWSFYLQRPGSTDSLRSISTDGLFISLLFEGTKQIIWGKACSLHRRCCDSQPALDVQEMHKLLSWQVKSQPPKTPCSKLISLWFKEKEIQISVSPSKKTSIPCLAAQ